MAETTFTIRVDIAEAIKDYEFEGYHEGLAWYLANRGVPWTAAVEIERKYFDKTLAL